MATHKLIPLTTYNNILEEQSEKRKLELLDTKLEQLGKLTQKKARKLIELLEEYGVKVSETGEAGSEIFSGDIFPFIKYCVRGRGKPAEWDNFVKILSKIHDVKSLLVNKAFNDVQKERRRKR